VHGHQLAAAVALCRCLELRHHPPVHGEGRGAVGGCACRWQWLHRACVLCVCVCVCVCVQVCSDGRWRCGENPFGLEPRAQSLELRTQNPEPRTQSTEPRTPQNQTQNTKHRTKTQNRKPAGGASCKGEGRLAPCSGSRRGGIQSGSQQTHQYCPKHPT